MENKTVTAIIEVKLPILKDLPHAGFLLNIGALTLSLDGKNFILDSIQTDYESKQKSGSIIRFCSTLAIDLETFEKGKEYNYELTEVDLENKNLAATFYCSDCDAGIDDAFDYDNAIVDCTVTVNGKEYKISKVTLEV